MAIVERERKVAIQQQLTLPDITLMKSSQGLSKAETLKTKPHNYTMCLAW